jgi:hypothetical protein
MTWENVTEVDGKWREYFRSTKRINRNRSKVFSLENLDEQDVIENILKAWFLYHKSRFHLIDKIAWFKFCNVISKLKYRDYFLSRLNKLMTVEQLHFYFARLPAFLTDWSIDLSAFDHIALSDRQIDRQTDILDIASQYLYYVLLFDVLLPRTPTYELRTDFYC